MKASVHFLWFDFWVGWFWDRAKRVLYVCPLPMCVLKLDFGKTLKVPPDAEIDWEALNHNPLRRDRQ